MEAITEKIENGIIYADILLSSGRFATLAYQRKNDRDYCVVRSGNAKPYDSAAPKVRLMGSAGPEPEDFAADVYFDDVQDVADIAHAFKVMKQALAYSILVA